MKTLVLVLDLAGTFVFALSGAMAAVRHRLDVFGVLVVSFAAATSGGMGRDLLIGAVPPAAIADWRYVATSALAGLVIFYWTPKKLGTPLLIFDGAGLAFFAVSGSFEGLPIRRSARRCGLTWRTHWHWWRHGTGHPR